jgi:KDO2-lipid IV(A) lauroyltransferase
VPWHFIAALIGRLPWNWLRSAGALVGWVTGSLFRIRRAHAVAALRCSGLAHPGRIASQVYASLGSMAFEFLWMSGRAGRPLDDLVQVSPDDWKQIERLIERGRGLVVATAHCGNWDLLACAVAARLPLTVVTRHLSWRSADRFWQRSRAARGVRIADGPGTLSTAMRALAQGGVVAFMVDQAPERSHGVMVDPFLGAPARHDLSFALVAMRAHAPIMVAVDERLPCGRHRLHIRLVIDPPDRPTRAWTLETARQVNESIARFVSEYPGQWLWLHRRWKGAPIRARLARARPRVSVCA